MPNWGNLFGGNDGKGFEWDKLAEIMGNVDINNPLEQIQQSNIERIFNPPMGNDMPQQGGITGQPIVSWEDGIRFGEIAQRERGQAQLPMPNATMTGIDQFAQKPLPNVISQEDIGSQSEGFIPPEIDYHKRMLELYKPETQDSDRLEAIISRMPQRNKPGVMRKIAAALSGLTGDLRVVDRSLYGPYYNQMADWKNEYEPAKDLAQEERYSNNNARMLANSMLLQDRSDRRMDESERKNRSTEDIKLKELARKEKRDAAYIWKTRNPNAQIKVDQKTGNLVGINPQTLKSEIITGSDGEPISGRDLSFVDRQNILQENALERIEAVGDRQLRVLPSQTAAQIELIDKRASVKSEDKDLSPSAQRTAKLARAEALIADHPELTKWIAINGDDVTIEPFKPGKLWNSGPENYEAIKDHIIHGKPYVKKEVKTPILDSSKATNKDVNKAAPGIPPVEKRTKGMKFTFPNGNIGQWDGTKWVPIKIVKR